MRRAGWIIGLCATVGLLAACEGEPSGRVTVSAPPASFRLGLPDRIEAVAAFAAESTVVDVTDRLDVPAAALVSASADSVTLHAIGQPLRVTFRPPGLPHRDLFGVRVGYRGTLGGELAISWRQGGESFSRAHTAVSVPGGQEDVTVILGFGPTKEMGARMSEVGIEVPASEVGTVTLHDVALVFRPGRVLHAASLDDRYREALAPGPGRTLVWDLDVPPGARLEFDFGTHESAWSRHGDGTRFRVEVTGRRGRSELMDRWLCPWANPGDRRWQHAAIDLSRWAGQSVELRLATVAGPDAGGPFPRSAEVSDDEPLFTVPRILVEGDDRPSVLLLVIDTLRRDALGVHGGGPTPVLDSLAAQGTRFDGAWSGGSWTHPGVASLLSGWAPSRHHLGFGPPGTTRLDPRTPMVAEQFRDAGWATAAVSNNRIVSVSEGFARGFTAFDESAVAWTPGGTARELTHKGLEWIDGHAASPWFLYLHYIDPHDRYQAPPPFTRRFVDASLQERIRDSSVRAGRPNRFTGALGNPRDPEPGEIDYLRGLYRGEVAFVDAWIGRLLDGLRERGQLENTLIVVTSDHGEEFGEHGWYKHAHSVYEELVAVPLIVIRPDRLGAGHVVNTPVSLLGLAPTLRSVAGLPAVKTPDPGATAWPFADRPARPLVAENWPLGGIGPEGSQRALLDWPMKFIDYRQAGSAELFDLSSDPEERADLGAVEVRARMRALLDSLMGAPDPALKDAPVDPALVEKLKAMGYVH